ncbi:MAG: hypothetical protein HY598_01210 [Candidatus Omnitrophica bacterium]|nr:hypothetical protein [Candidatus Omnitrophota bacterium]
MKVKKSFSNNTAQGSRLKAQGHGPRLQPSAFSLQPSRVAGWLVMACLSMMVCSHKAWAVDEPVDTEPSAEQASVGDPDAVTEPSRPSEVVPSLGMDERVSLDLRNTEATDALKYLAAKGGLNMSISKNVSGRVNLFLTDVPLRDVFDLVLRSNELAFDTQGNIYNIMTEPEYRALYGRRFSDLREVRSFRLKYAIPEQAFNTMDALKSEIGRLLVDEDSGSVLVMDVPENIRRMEEALLNLEQQNTIRIFDLHYAKSKDVEERLKDELETKKLGSVKADERTNQVVVKALPDRMKDVEKIVAALDRKTREVLIDAKIVKVTLTNDKDSGINWDSVFTNLKFHGIDTTNSFRNTTTGTAPSEVPGVTKLHLPTIKAEKELGVDDIRGLGDLTFGTVARDGYELFRYLATIGHTKVMSNPRLLVTENQEARIHVGTREAFVTTTTTTGQTTSTTAEEVQFIDVGIQFVVTPRIGADGYVTMKLKPEVSSVVRTLTTPSNNKIPIVDTSTAETNVVVKDGSTVIIGGLQKREEIVSDKQLPGLGKIPIIGPALFNLKDQDNEKAELVVFITPHIVGGDKLITGDEDAFGGGIKSYREYAPLLDAPTAPPALPQLGQLRDDE